MGTGGREVFHESSAVEQGMKLGEQSQVWGGRQEGVYRIHRGVGQGERKAAGGV